VAVDNRAEPRRTTPDGVRLAQSDGPDGRHRRSAPYPREAAVSRERLTEPARQGLPIRPLPKSNGCRSLVPLDRTEGDSGWPVVVARLSEPSGESRTRGSHGLAKPRVALLGRTGVALLG
jgi:hypothetical protein